MKKTTILLVSMLLVLSIGQTVLAKGSVNLGVGYNKFLGAATPSGMAISLDADYYFTKNFSLDAEFNTDLYFTDNYYFFNFGLFARYDILKTNMITVGLQLGLMDSLVSKQDIPNLLFIAPGAYANFSVGANFNIYADVKLPVGVFVLGDNSQFAPLYIYNFTLGATYNITSYINVGLEANINNCTYSNFTSPSIPDFSIEAKVGYMF